MTEDAHKNLSIFIFKEARAEYITVNPDFPETACDSASNGFKKLL